eukprot:1158273-Pelagomonas_calceolata.AAC.1
MEQPHLMHQGASSVPALWLHSTFVSLFLLYSRPPGGAAAYAPHGGAPTNRPAVRRKVNFTEDTRFRDSTEDTHVSVFVYATAGGGGGRGTHGPGPSSLQPKQQPQAPHKGSRGGASGVTRPGSAPRASRPASHPAGGSLLAGLYGYGSHDIHSPPPGVTRGAERGRGGGALGNGKGRGGGASSGQGAGSVGRVQDRTARLGSAQRGVPLKAGLGGKHVAYPAAAAAAAASSSA